MDSVYLTQLHHYRDQLARLRQAWGGVYRLPEVDFFLFGMGNRTKLIYQKGVLREAFSGTILRQWDFSAELILPPAYKVVLKTVDGQHVEIVEDEQGIWIIEAEQSLPFSARESKAEGEVLHLPTFEPHPFAAVLRVLHQEILVNIIGGQPVPNYFVYSRPWYRDGAMMAMVLKETGNLHLLREWILGLADPYDHNNANDEPDNLGQALYLLSLFGQAVHPLVARILAELHKYQDHRISGLTDGSPHPVYQTKWLKYGLQSLGLPDPWEIPREADDYSALFWWAFQNEHVANGRMVRSEYPYLTWASDRFYGERRALMGDRDYPLTWEANASQADYARMGNISTDYTHRRLAAPHTWHSAEMFFRLLKES